MDIRILTAAELDEAIVLAKEVILSETDVSWSKEAANSISEFIIAKHRNGPQATINLLFKKDTSTFLNMSKEEKEE